MNRKEILIFFVSFYFFLTDFGFSNNQIDLKKENIILRRDLELEKERIKMLEKKLLVFEKNCFKKTTEKSFLPYIGLTGGAEFNLKNEVIPFLGFNLGLIFN